MIVRQFLHWIRNAPASMRAEATSALTRAYLHSGLSADDLAAAEGAMLMLLDDPSPLVRLALAEGLADSPHAPPAVIHALAGDQPEIAAVILEHSLLFIDADLVEIVATGTATSQAAIARRVHLPRAVAAAIAEVGSAESCLILIENPDADVAQFSIDRIAARFGTLAAIRESLLARIDLPASTRQALVSKLSEALADFVTARQWLGRDRAQRVVKEACEKAAVTIAADVPSEARALVKHLCANSQLNAGLLLRALLSGNIVLFAESLAELSEVPLARVRGIIQDRGAASFRALYDKSGLPGSTYPAFREAIAALREASYAGDFGGSSRLKRRMIERVLRGCERSEVGEIEPLLMLLRRFATEAAREEARMFCDEIVAQDDMDAQEDAYAREQAIDALPAAIAAALALEDASTEAYGAPMPAAGNYSAGAQENYQDGYYDYADEPLAYENFEPQPASTQDWPQVHFAPNHGPQFEPARDRGYGQKDYYDGAYEPRLYAGTGYEDFAHGNSYPGHAEPARDPLIELFHQHLGSEADAPSNYWPARDPLLNYRPANDLPGLPRRNQRAAA